MTILNSSQPTFPFFRKKGFASSVSSSYSSLLAVTCCIILLLLHPVQVQGGGGGSSPHHYLREGRSARRNLLPHWFCSFFDDTIDHRCAHHENSGSNATNVTCPLVEPLSNDTSVFNMTNFTASSWFVQKQQINGFQPSVTNDFYCLVHTFLPRQQDNFFDYIQYGTQYNVSGPQQHWEVGEGIPEALSTWCGGQDEDGGGLLRIAPCLLRTLLAKVGFPMWVIAIAPDYSWSIISGGKPQSMRQVYPQPLCTTRTNVSAEVLADTSGAGLWLLTRKRMASNDTIAEMEQVLTNMGIYTEDLHPVVQEGCNYNNSQLIE